MGTLVNILVRIVVIGAAVLFAASVAVAFTLLACAWVVRAGWARLTGRQVRPFVVRMNPRGGFDSVYRRDGVDRGPIRAARTIGDVTDVEPKRPAA